MNVPARVALSLAALFASTQLLAADACSTYKWDVQREVGLFAATPTALAAAANAATAPLITTDTHYALQLQPQDAVQYAVPPSKRMLADGAHGGVLKFQVARPGAYRIALDAGFWIDVVQEGRSLPALDFNGQRDCVGPHKIVVYELPAGVELVLQLAAATTDTARLAVTPVAAATP
jgi:hypothetical protein